MRGPWIYDRREYEEHCVTDSLKFNWVAVLHLKIEVFSKAKHRANLKTKIKTTVKASIRN